MTRKRFKKLLMSHGVSRNTAEGAINILVASHRSTKVVAGYGRVTPYMRKRAREFAAEMQELLQWYGL